MRAYILLPVYNTNVDEELINTDIVDNYRIITNEIFFEKYKQKVVGNTPTSVYTLLEDDIGLPYPGMLYTRPLAKYIIFKEFNIENNSDPLDYLKTREKALLSSLMLSLRLIQPGRCQVNNCYIFTERYTQACVKLDYFSTNIEDMLSWASLERAYPRLIYKISKSTVSKLQQTCSIIKLYSNKVLIPVLYFMKYYNNVSMYDCLITLAIILESSVLAGLKQELNYRLKIRTCAFLERDYTELIDIFYSLRSNIVHNGFIKEECFKKLKLFLKNEKSSETDLLFIFISEYIEPLIRDILYKSLKIFANDQSVDNYEKLFLSVDKEIITKLACNI